MKDDILIILLGAKMPGIPGAATATVPDTGMSASGLASNSALGFIVIGALAFILGVLVTILGHRLRMTNKPDNTGASGQDNESGQSDKNRADVF